MVKQSSQAPERPEAAEGVVANGAAVAPPRKRHRARTILIVVAAVLVVLVAGSFVAAEVTAKSTFCANCHEMDPYYTSWQGSTHKTAQCAQCHVPPGFVHFVATKAYALREVWIHFTGQVKAPLAVTRAIPNSSCFRCHQTPPDANLGNAVFSHQKHAATNCIACHVRLVHRNVVGDETTPTYSNPAAMSSCFRCHDIGKVEGGCAFCHTAPHEPRGACADCHNLQSWTGAVPTDHPFKLTDTHATLACAACHKADSSLGLIPGTSLGKASPQCSFCHKTPHVSPTDCERCHTPKAWKPPNFTHPQVGEHMPSGRVSVACTDCHPNGFATSTCTKCHEGTPGGD